MRPTLTIPTLSRRKLSNTALCAETTGSFPEELKEDVAIRAHTADDRGRKGVSIAQRRCSKYGFEVLINTPARTFNSFVVDVA